MKLHHGKFFVFIIAILLLIPLQNAYAEEIMPYADPEFAEAFISFYSDGEADFECVTYEQKSSLYVRSCQLQRKSGSSWVNVGSSTTGPSRSNASAYVHTVDYSSKITTAGVYRVKGTFVADGYTKTKYSAERTFN